VSVKADKRVGHVAGMGEKSKAYRVREEKR
jgi:hypothetical protein